MKKRVIIDCDPGIDDSLALMYALSSEALDVIGITVVCGNVPTDIGVENARKVCRLMGRTDIPVYAGASVPLKRPLVTAQDTHGMDGLGETGIPLVPESEWPVSYTHLDVYKRQIYDGWILNFSGGYTYRANCIYPFYHSSYDLKEKVIYLSLIHI